MHVPDGDRDHGQGVQSERDSDLILRSERMEKARVSVEIVASQEICCYENVFCLPVLTCVLLPAAM